MGQLSNAQIGERCRALRLSRKLTLQALADGAGLSKGHLSRFERGEKTLSLASLFRLADVMNVTIGTLCDHRPASGKAQIMRKHERQFLAMAGEQDALNYAVLSGNSSGSKHQVLLLKIPAQRQLPEPAHHSGYEAIFVLKGAIDLLIGEERLSLETGDYAEFNGQEPHILESRGVDSEVLLTIFPD